MSRSRAPVIQRRWHNRRHREYHRASANQRAFADRHARDMVALLPIPARLFTVVFTTASLPQSEECRLDDGARVKIVSKHHAVAHKNFILDNDAFTHKL